MREIKFRGYDTESKRWRYGSYFLKEDITLSPICDDPNEWENDKRANEHHLIIWNGSSDWNLPKPHYQSEVNGDTVGQYTEFHDKNGKEIYEGDIVRCEDIINGIVFSAFIEFGNPNGTYDWGWQLHYIKGDRPNLDILCWIDTEYYDDAKIIGNIYENPELLESEAEE